MVKQQNHYIFDKNTSVSGSSIRNKRRSSIKATLSAIAAATTLGGLSAKGILTRNKPDSDAKAPALQQNVQNTPSDVSFYELEPNHPLNTPAAKTRMIIFEQIVSRLKSINPPKTSLLQLHQQAALLQTLSTKPDGVCTAFLLSQDNLSRFVEMARSIPSDQLSLVIGDLSKSTALYSFKPLAQAIQNTPTNSFSVAQQMYLQQARYKTHEALLDHLAHYEGDTNYIYLDVATKTSKGKKIPDCNPTVGKGINLRAHPDILPHIRIQNSPKLQGILHPKDPSKRSRDPYVCLTPSELNTWRQYAIDHDFFNHKAEDFLKNFQMVVHPDDMSYLEQRFQKAVSVAVKTAEAQLEQRTCKTVPDNESVMFGSFQNPLPTRFSCVPADLTFSCKDPLRSGWKKFCKYYEQRNFWKAAQETYSKQQGFNRSFWRFHNVAPTKYRVGAKVALGGLGLGLLAALHSKFRKKVR